MRRHGLAHELVLHLAPIFLGAGTQPADAHAA
jgi:hypothetical protein